MSANFRKDAPSGSHVTSLSVGNWLKFDCSTSFHLISLIILYFVLLELQNMSEIFRNVVSSGSQVTTLSVGNWLKNDCRYEFSLNFFNSFLICSTRAAKYICKFWKSCAQQFPSYITFCWQMAEIWLQVQVFTWFL